MSFINQFDQIWKIFIRPPRQVYSLFDLGSPVIQANKYKAKRQDFEIKNSRNMTLKCSLFEPQSIDENQQYKKKQNKGVIIYLHCFNGSRIESIKFAELVIQYNVSFCCFDFAGSGLSDGIYVTLGYYEQNDISVVVNYLRNDKQYSEIALWGRSMGAVTSLLYAQKDPKLCVIALDSPFTNMDKLAQEISKAKTSLPNIILKGALAIIKSQIKKKANFDLEDVNVMKQLENCNMPALFITSKQDTLINTKHTDKIFSNYKGPKKLIYVKGDHNESRDQEFLKEIIEFLVRHFSSYTKYNNDVIRMDRKKHPEKIDLHQNQYFNNRQNENKIK